MKLKAQGVGATGLPLHNESSSTRVVQWHAATGPVGFVSARAPSRDAASEGSTTVLHAEHLHTRDWVPVNVVVALHWHFRDVQRAAVAVALSRSNVKSVTQASLAEVVGSTMLSALLVEHSMVELRLCNRMASALAGLGIGLRSCRIRDVAVPPDVQDSGVARVLEQLAQVRHRERVIRLWGLQPA